MESDGWGAGWRQLQEQEEEQQFLEDVGMNEAIKGGKVYMAICRVTADLAQVGISKDRKNSQQGYAFRGIDDVYCTLSALLAKHQLCILPRVLDHHVVERETRNGGALFNTTVKMAFDLVSSEDGSTHTVITIGEAMDSADKSSNKAMSAAYKYMAFQTFCIPTEGDNDADAHTHEVTASRGKKASDEEAARQVEDALLRMAEEAAEQGTESYKKFWSRLNAQQKHTIGESRHADFKAKAEEADQTYVPE